MKKIKGIFILIPLLVIQLGFSSCFYERTTVYRVKPAPRHDNGLHRGWSNPHNPHNPIHKVPPGQAKHKPKK